MKTDTRLFNKLKNRNSVKSEECSYEVFYQVDALERFSSFFIFNVIVHVLTTFIAELLVCA